MPLKQQVNYSWYMWTISAKYRNRTLWIIRCQHFWRGLRYFEETEKKKKKNQREAALFTATITWTTALQILRLNTSSFLHDRFAAQWIHVLPQQEVFFFTFTFAQLVRASRKLERKYGRNVYKDCNTIKVIAQK